MQVYMYVVKKVIVPDIDQNRNSVERAESGHLQLDKALHIYFIM